ncbi:MAG: CBS domain-containing protein [Alphaproteobacteria bacterium]
MMKTAADVMTTDVLTVTPDTPVTEVAGLLVNNRITAVPVVSREGQLLGMVSEDELIRSAEAHREPDQAWWLTLLTSTTAELKEFMGQGDRKVEEVMSRDVMIASEGDSLRKLVAMLAQRRIRQLPIVRGGRLVGIVSRVDILRYLARERTVL